MAFLEIKGFRKSFGETCVLNDISLTLERGEVLAIIGSSGSGKTTLLRCMNFLETPDEGVMTLNGQTLLDCSDGRAVSEAEYREKRLHFGLVFQAFHLFPQYTVQRNITLAPSLRAKEDYKKKLIDKSAYVQRLADIEAHAASLIARVGLTGKENAYPCELSGGQCQRVAIARALAQNPDILCFDEPTSALDPELTNEVLKVIRGLKSTDSTMIVVTHEMEFARNVADKVIYMANGIIEEAGTPEEVFGNPKSPLTKAFLTQAFEKI